MPNLPFFYLVYRAWSHWRALAGGKHIQFLLQNRLLNLTPSPLLDAVYAQRANQPLAPPAEPNIRPIEDQTDAKPSGPPNPTEDAMLLSQASGKEIAEGLGIPQLGVELERAIWQVETAINKQNTKGAENASAAGDSARRNDKKSQ